MLIRILFENLKRMVKLSSLSKDCCHMHMCAIGHVCAIIDTIHNYVDASELVKPDSFSEQKYLSNMSGR